MKNMFLAFVAVIALGVLAACKTDTESKVEYKYPATMLVSYETQDGLEVILADDSFGNVSLCSNGQSHLIHDETLHLLRNEVLRLRTVGELQVGYATIKYVAGYPSWGPITRWSPETPFEQECLYFAKGTGVDHTFLIYGQPMPSYYNGYLEWQPM